MEQYLTPEEAAELLRLTPSTLMIWRHKHEGPPYLRVNGKTVRYRRSDIDDWMATKEIDPNAMEDEDVR